ncbi:hypothetical protein VW23_007665 [Devosia insulae DS-56]|uniref:Uncharacterized protein n=1 Tax=Devosia insulae DS-56 TaxID=1116389 RepID=A0A1E5XXF8_9HYPH|nr:hypothetical protein [Devosia insulae]OEO33255.1 hypothetical protein VW23_007665 [Devosia insulae DS-56]
MNVTRSASLALAAILLSTSLASAGGIHIPGLGDSGSGGDSHPGDIFHQERPDHDSPDFGSIFNPQPELEVTINDDLFEVLNPPVDVVDLGIDMGNGAPGKGGKAKGAQLSANVKLGAALSCVVSGTPSEFPDDLRIANAGVVALPVGTQFKWKAAGISGVASLGKALQPGKALKLSNVLPGGVEAGTVCSAKAIGL